jgi:xanthine/uracil permease
MKPSYLYDLDDRSPASHMILYGLQWAFIVFPSLVIMANLGAAAMGSGSAGTVYFLQWTLLTAGIFTFLQTLWGHRYPLIEGPSTAIALTFILLAPAGLPAIQGGMITGGLLLVVLVVSGRLDRLLRYFTPNVTGVILMLISLGLLKPLIHFMSDVSPAHPHGDAVSLFLSLALTLLTACLSHHLKGIWKTLSILIGMIFGCLVFLAYGHLEFGDLLNAPWVSLSHLLPSSLAGFSWASSVAFCFAYLAVIVNSLGSLQGIAEITDRERLTRSTRRGIFLNGVGGILCGLVGVIGTVSYSMSPGIILANRVASRYALVYCGALLAVAAFIPKLAALLAVVPAAVVGAVLCVSLGGQLGVGISVLTAQKLTPRDYFVAGIPLIVGTMAGLLPRELVSTMPDFMQILLANSLVTGFLLVLLLEHLLLRKPYSAPPAEKEIHP